MAPRAKKSTLKKSKGLTSRRPKPDAKDETVETSTSVQLLLGNLPPDRDARVQYETLARLIDKSRTAAGHVSGHKKKMKEMGFDVEAFMNTMKKERMDPLDLANRLKEEARLGRLRGLPVQMQLYEPRYGSIEEQAKAEGFAAGKAGRTPDTARWTEGAPGYDDYMAAHLEGQKEILGQGEHAGSA